MVWQKVSPCWYIFLAMCSFSFNWILMFNFLHKTIGIEMGEERNVKKLDISLLYKQMMIGVHAARVYLLWNMRMV